MNATLGDLVLSAVSSQIARKEKTDGAFGDYRLKGNPLRPGSNSGGFKIRIHADGMYGCYFDHGPSGEHGSLYELAAALGIRYEFPQREKAEHTHREYAGLSDYAAAHGIPDKVLIDAKWAEVTHQGRPALYFPTKNGIRVRYLDHGESKYTNKETGYRSCWYGLDRALALLEGDPALYLTLCNGEVSTLCGQYHGIPAFCVTGGEKGSLRDDLLSELKDKIKTEGLLIALDCDAKGIESSIGLIDQLETAGIKTWYADLGFDKGGDLADFCRLYGIDSVTALQARMKEGRPVEKKANNGIVSIRDLADEYEDMLDGTISEGLPLPSPFNQLRQYGGMAARLYRKKLAAWGADTGVGKTAFVETHVDFWRARGIHGGAWSPEWTAREHLMRAIQRSGGPSLTAQLDHQAYLTGLKQGICAEKLEADGLHLLTPEQLDIARHNRDLVQRLPGNYVIFEGRKFSLDRIDKACELAERSGNPLSYVIIDYAQLLTSKTAERGQIDDALDELCILLDKWDLAGIVTSQITKASGAESMNGGKLSHHGLMNMRSDLPKLIITLTREMDKEGNYSEIASARISKNNMGRLGTGKLALLSGRMKWQDAIIVQANERPF